MINLALVFMVACGVLYYRVGQHELTITPSLGIAMYPADGESYEELSMRADAAMYQAKSRNRNTVIQVEPARRPRPTVR